MTPGKFPFAENHKLIQQRQERIGFTDPAPAKVTHKHRVGKARVHTCPPNTHSRVAMVYYHIEIVTPDYVSRIHTRPEDFTYDIVRKTPPAQHFIHSNDYKFPNAATKHVPVRHTHRETIVLPTPDRKSYGIQSKQIHNTLHHIYIHKRNYTHPANFSCALFHVHEHQCRE